MVGPWRTLRGQVPTVATYTDLRATEGREGAVVCLLGRDDADDGGQGLFRWVDGTATGDDDGTVLASINGRWERVVQGPTYAAWFGAKGDGSADDTDAIQAALNSAYDRGYPHVILPGTECAVSETIEIGARDGDSTDVMPGVTLEGVRSLEYHRTNLKWVGAAGGTVLRIRNASGTVLRGVGVNGMGSAAYGVQVTHKLGDTSVCTNVVLENGYAIDATVANVLVGEASGTSYGDCSGLLLNSFYCHQSSPGVTTASGILVTAQYSFGITLLSSRFTSNPSSGYPSANIRMYGGSITMQGGLLDTAGDAAVILEDHPDDPLAVFPSITLDTVEVQGGGKLLRTEYGGSAAPLRGVCLRNVLHSDIISPEETTSIYWDVPGFAVLYIDGGTRLIGNVEVASTSCKVMASGCFFAEGKGFTGTGAARVEGTWCVASGLAGVWNHRHPDLPTYADNAAAVSGGLLVGDLYKTSAGDLRVRV